MADNRAEFIDTEIDTSGAKKGAKELNSMFDKLKNSASKTKNTIQDAFSNFMNRGKNDNSLDEIRKEYEEITAKVNELKGEMDGLISKQEAWLENGGMQGDTVFQKYEEELTDVIEKYNNALFTQNEYNSVLPQTNAKTLALNNALKVLGKGLAGTVQYTLKLAGALLKLGGKAIVGAFNGIKKLKSGLDKLKGTMGTSNKEFKQGLVTMLKYGLSIRGMFALVKKLKTALADGFKNLAQFNGGNNEVNKSISALKNSLTQLKNSFATAFAPLLSVITPALTKFINLCIEGVNAIGMLIAKLNGLNVFTKAKKLTDDYAKSLGKATNSLYAFDELNTVAQDDGATSPANMFENVEISDEATSWADKIKQAFEEADFTEIGQHIGERLLDGINSIDLSGVRELAGRLGTSLATLVNGISSVDGLGYSLGTKIAEGINTAVQFVHNFITNLDFRQLGKQLGGAINGIKDTLDFTMLGETMGAKIKGILDFLIGAIQEIDWYSLGEKVREYLVAIDWSGIIHSMFELMGSALAGLAEFIWGFIHTAWDNVESWWTENVTNTGLNIVQGLWLGIKTAFKNAFTWIKTNMFEPFMNGFKSLFGIHSPSTVMAEMGGYLVQGLINGISKLIGKAKEKWVDFKEATIETFRQLWSGLKSILNTIIGGVEKMVNGVINGLNKMIEACNKLDFDIPDWIPVIGGKEFGLHIPTVSTVNIPRLATGTVVPRTAKEFTAVLGDNNRETEVVSPLSTMKQAFIEALNESGAGQGGDVYITADGDMDALIRMFNFKIDKEQARSGKNYRKVVTI